ncbi:MAG: hypothetical protein NWR72_15285, partial [Bacteroidia bacterium]|nr:hypothetical protein [Bacteroidia bacterium]
REMAIGNGRTDLAIFWKDQVSVIEVKLNHDVRTLPMGLRQISRYMDQLGQKRGHLVIFEKKHSSELSWEERIRKEIHQEDDREIVVWWM